MWVMRPCGLREAGELVCCGAVGVVEAGADGDDSVEIQSPRHTEG